LLETSLNQASREGLASACLVLNFSSLSRPKTCIATPSSQFGNCNVHIEKWELFSGHHQQTTLHSREVTLAHLEYRGFLVTSGEFKQKIYTLPGASLPTPDEVFSFASSPEMG